MDFNSLAFMKEFDESYITKEDLLKLYKFLSLDGKIDLKNFENLKSSLYVTSYKFKDSDKDRLATRSEVVKSVFGVYYIKENILDYYKTRYIEIILDYILIGKTYITDINREKLIKTYEYMFTDEFKNDLAKIKSSNIDSFNNSNISKGGILTKEVLKVIKKELDPDYGTKYSKMAFNIARKALKDKNYLLSKSQFDCISVEYSRLLRSKHSIENNILDKAKELVKVIKSNSSYDKLILDICNQAISKKYISDKQKRLLLNYSIDESLCGNNINDNSIDDIGNVDNLPDFNIIEWS